MRVIEFSIPVPIPTLNTWQRMHWALRQKETERMAWLCRVALGPTHEPIGRCKITVIRRATRLADLDNILVKPLLDAMVVQTKRNPFGIGVIVDDGPHNVLELVRRQEKVKKKDASTLVRIEEVAP